jgi:hypothetical protein
VQIFGDIPALHLNPFLVAESQRASMQGYVAISYRPDESPRFCDLLFLRGTRVYQCITLNEEHREQIDVDLARKHFADDLHPDTTFVYLFRASESTTNTFLSTLSTQCTLKVKVDTLSKRQIHTLLRSTNTPRVLAERNDFTQKLPGFEFLEIDPADPEMDFQLGFKHGGFMVYELKTPSASQRVNTIEPPSTLTGLQQPLEPTPCEPEPLQATEDFAEFLEEFLAKTPSPATSAKQKPLRSKINRSRGASLEKQKPAPLRDTTDTAAKSITIVDPVQAGTPSAIDESFIPPSQASPNDASEIVKLFQRVLRSFRQQAFDCFGQKAETILNQSERRVQILNPEFSLSTMDAGTASVVLDLIEDVIKHAPMLKRAKLRSVALILIADLYDKQYELLEGNKAIDRVEQLYYRLKR